MKVNNDSKDMNKVQDKIDKIIIIIEIDNQIWIKSL